MGNRPRSRQCRAFRPSDIQHSALQHQCFSLLQSGCLRISSVCCALFSCYLLDNPCPKVEKKTTRNQQRQQQQQRQFSRTSAPVQQAPGAVDATTNTNGRETLRGEEASTFDLTFEVLTPKQWSKWFKAPCEHAAAVGKRDLAQRLVGAGGQVGCALHKAVRDGRRGIVNDLLENEASVAAKDANGNT